MGIYLFILALISILAFIMLPSGRESTEQAYIAICFAALIIVASIRSYTVGVDTSQFYVAYVQIGMTPWVQLDAVFRYEWGFLIFCKLLNYVSSDPQMLLLASSCLINIPIAVFIYRNSKGLGLSVFLYVALAIYTSNMNIMREAMAVSIMLIGFELLRRKSYVPYVLFVILAAFFHRTAVVCLVFLPLWRSRANFNSKTLLVYVIACFFAFVFAHQISDAIAAILGKDQIYREEFTGSNYYGALIKTLFAFTLAAIVINYYHVGLRDGIDMTSEDSFYCHMLMLWVLFSVLGMQVEIFSRIGMYFSIFAPVGISCAMRFAGNRSERALLELSIGLVALTYFVVIGVFRPEWQGVIPYAVSTSIANAL